MNQIKAKLRKRYRYRNGKKTLRGYCAEFYNRNRQPRQKRISLGTRSKSAARHIFADLERRVAMELFDPWTDQLGDEALLVPEAKERFMKSRRRRGLAEATLSMYESITRLFCDSLPPGMMLRTVDTEHVEAFLGGQDLNENGHNSYLRQLRIFLSWCVEKGYIPENPAPPLPTGKRSRKSRAPKFLSEAQFDKLIEICRQDGAAKAGITDGNKYLTRVFRVGVGTGLRRGELCNLRWGAVNINYSMLHARNEEDFETKSGRERPVPLVGDAMRVLEDLQQVRSSDAPGDLVFTGMRGGRLNKRHLTRRFRFYREKAELPDGISFHSLRHTFASWWVQRGGDLYRLKKVLGHSTIEQTMRYAHLRPKALHEEMQKCFGEGRGEKTSDDNGVASEEQEESLQEELRKFREENERLRQKLGAD